MPNENEINPATVPPAIVRYDQLTAEERLEAIQDAQDERDAFVRSLRGLPPEDDDSEGSAVVNRSPRWLRPRLAEVPHSSGETHIPDDVIIAAKVAIAAARAELKKTNPEE